MVSTGNPAERRAKVQAMIESGHVTWDVFIEGEIEAEAPDHAERAANFDEFCQQLHDYC